jgi:catechol 2,3-dioxygenase-like lactoylglutathione lyase family enzyme
MDRSVPVLDHLALATPDLAASVRAFTERTGVEPAAGGSHLGLGTANYLVDLGGGSYLEIIGPDPEQPTPTAPRPFGIDELTEPRLVTWAVRTDDIDALVAQARDGGFDPGEPRAMSRRTPDGELLEWRLTAPRFEYGDGLVPFLIDWGNSPHPTERGLPRAALREFAAVHPDPASVRPALAALRVDLHVDIGERAELRAVVAGADGPAVL